MPIPHLQEEVALVAPQGTAPTAVGGIWVEVSVIPFDENIAGLFQFRATASHDTAASEQLHVDGPYRLSGVVASPGGHTPALWLIRVTPPKSAARIQVSYALNLMQKLSGEKCSGPLSVRGVGAFQFIPANGTGP